MTSTPPRRKVLGAILAGGQAKRFGSDKALAIIGGHTMIETICDALSTQVDDLVICGRRMPDRASLGDRPRPNLGPLGGLCAALHHAQTMGYDAVLSVGSDIVPIPSQLRVWLEQKCEDNTRPTVVAGQHLLGLWPGHISKALDIHLENSGDRSMHAWIAICGAVSVAVPVDLTNINTRAELERFRAALSWPA
jgi:molybdenum cofactor guanylyltransferase